MDGEAAGAGRRHLGGASWPGATPRTTPRSIAASPPLEAGRRGHPHLHLGHHRHAQGASCSPSATSPSSPRRSQELLPVRAGDRLISYLPLSHIAEQVVSHLLSIATGACVYFAESLEKLPENLREVRPHFFLGVPRVWEKIQAGMQAAGAQASPLRRRIAAWARGRGPGRRLRRPGRPPASLELRHRRPPGLLEGAGPAGLRRRPACWSSPPRRSPRRPSTSSRAWACRSWRSTA